MANKKLATVKLPDGTTADIIGPEDSSQEAILAQVESVKRQFSESKKQQSPAQQPQQAQQPQPATTQQATQQSAPRQEGFDETLRNLLGGVNSFLGTNVSEPAIAILDLGKTIVTGALGTVAGGIAGGAGALLPGEENQAEDARAATEKFITLDLFTDPGQRLAQQIATNLEKKSIPPFWRGRFPRGGDSFLLSPKEAGQEISDLIYEMSGGNPSIATGIRTILYGAPDIFLGRTPFKGTPALTVAKQAAARTNTLKTRVREISEAAEKAGYKLNNDELPDSIVAVADAMSPERHAAANVDEIQDSVRSVMDNLKKEVDTLYADARSRKAVIDIVPLQNTVEDTVKRLVTDGFDLREMPRLRKRIEDFSNLQFINKSGTATKLDLNKAVLLERRLTNDLLGKKRLQFNSEDVATLRLRNSVRDHIDDVFNRGAITGDPEALAAWKLARGKASQLARFKEDKIIRNLVRKDASAEEIYRWIVGASSMGATKQSVRTLRRLKEILGDDNPVFTTMRKAALRDILLPAFADTPNFKKLISNIDRATLENPTLMKELSIPIDDLKRMKAAAHAALKIRPPFPDWVNRSWVVRSLASIIFGHQIARKGTIVRSAHRITEALLKTGNLTKKEIMNHLSEIDLTTPAVVPKSPLWADIMVRGAIADLSNDDEDEDQFQ